MIKPCKQPKKLFITQIQTIIARQTTTQTPQNDFAQPAERKIKPKQNSATPAEQNQTKRKKTKNKEKKITITS